MLVTEKINNVTIAYDPHYTHSVREYYLYCIHLFRKIMQYKDPEINIIFGEADYDFKNDLPIKRVILQYEHTLVKPGGRDSDGFPTGQISMNHNGFYLVRLANYPLIERSDVVIEYSIPNERNIFYSTAYPAYNNRRIYVAPCLYEVDFRTNRSRDVSTNFFDTNQPRRRQLLDALQKVGVRNYHAYDCHLTELYSSTKVLVNAHQTDHHDTLEELRVLPALRRGAIIVSEHSALEECVPYKNHVIWANYNDIPAVVEDVLKNYNDYRDSLFNDKLRDLFHKLENTNVSEVLRATQCLL